MTLHIAVVPPKYDPTLAKILFQWSVPAGSNLGLANNRFEVRFSPAPGRLAAVEIFDMFCGCLLPHLALNAQHVAIEGLPKVPSAVHHFWSNYLRLLGIASTVRFTAHEADASPVATEAEIPGPRPGLYFGGGVESLSLLSLIKHLKPYLLSVDGPAWMNSDHDKSSIKRNLQDQLSREHGFEFLRAWTDLRTLFPHGDTYINRYLAGTILHYLLVPLLRHHRVATTYIAAELEYALYELPFDHSLHARFIHNVVRPPNPPLLSPLNAIPKIELFDGLFQRDPELCSYLYSCLFNTSKRWCGECGKCRRISAYCEAIGISKSLIGMQEGIESRAETGRGTTDRYWQELARYRQNKHRGLSQESAPAWRWLRLLNRILRPMNRV